MAPVRWRVALSLAVLFLAAPLLAGCVGSASAASAREWQSPADEAAQEWDADAQLVNVIGVEGTFPVQLAAMLFDFHESAGEADWNDAQEDDEVGDGKARLWLYRYVAPEKDAAYLVVVAKNKVIHEAEDERRADDTPVGEWVLDSDAALDVALGHNEALSAGVERERYGIGAILTRESADATPTWLVAGLGADLNGAGGGFVLIDATSGDIIASEGMSA